MIEFECPHCRNETSADDEHAGKRGLCPECKKSFVIPDGEPPRKKKPASEENDTESKPPAFPMTVTLAGIAWIGIGGLIILMSFVIVMALLFQVRPDETGTVVERVMGVAVCITAILGLFGGAFIFVGVESVRGRARDTLGNGIGSLIFAVLQLGVAIGNAGSDSFRQAGINGVCGLGFLAAGILALMGRSQYKAWRKAERRRNDNRRAAVIRERGG